MILDLTDNSWFTTDEQLILYNATLKIRPVYNKIIEKLSIENKFDYRWWFTEIASRNIYSNNLFLHLSYLAFVNELIKKKNIHKIVVGSKSLYKTLKSSKIIKDKGILIVLKKPLITRIKSQFAPIVGYILTSFNVIKNYLIIRTHIRNNNHIPKGITFVDTFLLEDSFKENTFFDRYLPNYEKHLSDKEKSLIYYVPTFHKIKNYRSIINKISLSSHNFIIKELFLKLDDILLSLLFPIITLGFTLNANTFLGFNIQPLLRRSVFKNLSSKGQIIAYQNFHFAKRLKKKKIKIRLIIDWFENQVIDKGFNLGFRSFYPEVKHRGYQVVLDNLFYMCYYPTYEEFKAKVLPKEIFVSGKAFKSKVKEYCKEVKVNLAPAFRYQHVWNEQNLFPNNGKKTVLITLPYFKDELLHILKTVENLLKSHEFKLFNYWIKPHPVHSKNDIKKIFGNPWPKEFECVDDNLGELLDQSSLVICNNSTVLLEIITKGTPVIIIGNKTSMAQFSLPTLVDESTWKICFNVEELKNEMRFFLNLSPNLKRKLITAGKTAKPLLFEKETRSLTRQFFMLE